MDRHSQGLTGLTTTTAAGFAARAYIAYISTLVGFGACGWLMRWYDAGQVAMNSLLVSPFGLASTATLARP